VALEQTEIWSWVLKGPETKNKCAGEGQQQITTILSAHTYIHTYVHTQKQTYARDIFRCTMKRRVRNVAYKTKSTGLLSFQIWAYEGCFFKAAEEGGLLKKCVSNINK
jgi:hypothetical protein